MAIHDIVKAFDDAKIRVAWDDAEEKWYFSVVDVVGVLTEQQTARNASTYWAVLKKRLTEEGADELLTNCKRLKLTASDGKMRETDVADLERILRIIQSIPSKSRERQTQGIGETVGAAKDGAEVARNARADVEHRLGHSVISNLRAIDHITPKDELPFEK
ncbi:MAG: hypothetical protein IJT12_05135 [Paludibacteraceae bacterium]|nr:hypothetical protein [Paludibacteraceae bacterium]